MYVDVLSFDSPAVVGKAEVSDDVFGQSYRPDILSMVVRWQLAKRRLGCHKTKGISEVSGTTRKPYKQKGTGRARQGSLRSPQFRGGAVIFGPVVRSHAFGLNKKFRKLALKVALSYKLASHSLYYIRGVNFVSEKASGLRVWLDSHEILAPKSSVLFIVDSVGSNLCRASSNLLSVSVLPVVGLNVYDLLRYDHVVVLEDACIGLNKRFSVV